MVRRTSLRAIAPIILLATSLATGCPAAYAQGHDDLERLAQQTTACTATGPYAVAISLANSWSNSADGYSSESRYAEAEYQYRTALAIYAEVIGQHLVTVETVLNNLTVLPDCREVAVILNKLAQVYESEWRYDAAELLFKTALAIDANVFGQHRVTVETVLNDLTALPYNPDLGMDLNNLAGVYREEGRYAEAEPLYKRALNIFEHTTDANHAESVGILLNNLALLYLNERSYDKAEPLALQALALAANVVGKNHLTAETVLKDLTALPEHPSVAIRLNNLAGLYEDQGHYDEAEPLYKRAIAIDEKALGADHPIVARMRINLGSLYKSQSQPRYDDAEPLLKSALEIMEKEKEKEKGFGPTHRELAFILSQLGDLYRLQKKCDQAEKFFRSARSIGAGAIREVPVLFGTDRKRDTTSKLSVVFGGERDEKLSFGLVIITVPEPSGSVVTEARHLATHCIQVVDDQQIVEEAVHQVDDAKVYPSQALVFVHGYNTSFEDAARRAAQIAYDIKFDGATFLFSWPSQGRLLEYFRDSDSVEIAVDHLRDFLKKIVAEAKVTKIHFIAHSMGNMVLLRTLERVAREDANLHGLIGEIIEAAPDVDAVVYRHMIEAINPEASNPTASHKVTLYAAHVDWALWVSGWIRGLARAGYVGKDQPLIVAGVDTIDITSAGTSLFDMNHDLYASNPILVADMRRIIEKGEWPPDKRTKEFESVTSKDGKTYWRLLPPQAQTTVH
jgi:esterase/lipase superfamily enzyme/tetratricopeptide (TPR) repeat protein